jgi:hypothetical protein
MGTEKTDDPKPTDETTASPADKPFSVRMMDAVADSAAALTKAVLTSGIVKVDEAVKKTRKVVAAVEKRAKTATKKLAKRTAATKTAANKPAAKKSKSVAKKTVAKITIPKKSTAKKAVAKTPAKKTTKKKNPNRSADAIAVLPKCTRARTCDCSCLQSCTGAYVNKPLARMTRAPGGIIADIRFSQSG